MKKLIGYLPDALILSGAAGVIYGIWSIMPAAGYIAAGAVAVALGVVLSPDK